MPHVCIGHLPLDQTRVLHPSEDKMAIRSLDLPRMFKLLRTGEIETFGEGGEPQVGQLVDFLDLRRPITASSSDQVHFIGFDSSLDDNQQVLMNFRRIFAAREMSQREKILPYLRTIFETAGVKKSGSKSTQRVAHLLRHPLSEPTLEKKYSGSLRASVDLANFAKETSSENAGKNKMQAVLRFIYALSEAKFFYDDYIEIARQNPLLSDFAERIKIFLTGISSADVPAGVGLKTKLALKAKGLKTLLEDDGVLVDELIENDFIHAFGMEREELTDRVKLVDSVSAYILKTLRESGLEAKELAIDPVVAQASLSKLLEIAFGLDKSNWKEEVRREMEADGSPAELVRARIKKIAFEARRKLSLLYLVGEPHKKYQELVSLGDLDFDGLVLDRVAPVFEEKKPGKRARRHLGNKRSTGLYRTANFDSELGIREILAPPKGEEAYICKAIRKNITDPANILDIRRQGLVFFETAGTPERLFKRKTKVLTTYDFDEKSGLVSEARPRSYEDSVSVLKLIEALSALPGVRVMEYKPTPPEGEGIKSDSPGGGAKLRFAIFIIRYSGKDGVNRDKEIQVFTPDLKKGTTAIMHVFEKEEEHRNYEISRITIAEQHDLVKLFYPQNIYPEVWGAYRKREQQSV